MKFMGSFVNRGGRADRTINRLCPKWPDRPAWEEEISRRNGYGKQRKPEFACATNMEQCYKSQPGIVLRGSIKQALFLNALGFY